MIDRLNKPAMLKTSSTETKGFKPLRDSLVHMRSHSGHRKEYQDLFVKLFGLTPSNGRINVSKLYQLVGARQLLFGTIDDDYVGFFLVAILRTLLQRRTVGLFLRPQSCFHTKSPRNSIKRIAFALLKRLRPVSVLTMVPFSIAPEYAEVADDGVVDPQLWDLNIARAGTVDSDLLAQITEAADGRRTLAFIGTVSAIKGIGWLRDLMNAPNWPSSGIFVIVAGNFPIGNGVSPNQMRELGGLVIDRHISDSELRAVYATADLIWSFYDPRYNQASGVFGRAVQAGRSPIVRAESLIARFARQIGVFTVELDWEATPQACLAALVAQVGSDVERRVSHQEIANWRRDFSTTIRRAL